MTGLLERLLGIAIVLALVAVLVRWSVDLVRPVLPWLVGLVLLGLGGLVVARFLLRRGGW